jgi:ketosteroid isomerase-like protein
MRASLLLASSLVALFGISCSSPAAREFGKPDIDSINQMFQEFVTSYNAKDTTKLVTYFTPGGVVLPPNASTVRGTENVREYYIRRFARGASDLTLDPRDIAGSGSIAFANGDYSLNMAPLDGPVRRDRGKFLFVLRDFKGKWLLDQLMFSSDFAPEVAPAPTS